MSTKFNWYLATSENCDLCYAFWNMHRTDKIDSHTCDEKKKNNNNGKNEEKRDQNVVDKLKKNFEMLPYAIFCKLCKNTFP